VSESHFTLLLLACILAAMSAAVLLIRRQIIRSHTLIRTALDRASFSSATAAKQLEALLAIYAEIQVRGLPPTGGWAASPDFLRRLVDETMRADRQTIVECGCGVSTVVLARCAQMRGSGHVFSLEHNAQFAAATRAELERRGLDGHATVIDAPLQHYELDNGAYDWYSLANLNSRRIDLLVVDGPPSTSNPLARYPALPLLESHLHSGSTVLLDDTARAGEREMIRLWIARNKQLRVEDLDCEKGCTRIEGFSGAPTSQESASAASNKKNS
jgi:predicted O-methyltransferase YrrM